MVEKARGMLFRKRNILGVALVAGIGLGVYLGRFKGFGLGGSDSTGSGSSSSENQVSTESDSDEREVPLTMERPEVIKVLIDDREFLLRKTSGDTPISLPQLMKLVKTAIGDAEGVRLRIYEKGTARMSSEEDLKNALVSHRIPDSAVLWIPIPVK